ncbi:MAG: hypothetical protein ACXU82_05410 [Caulobacteraceae bacterium]
MNRLIAPYMALAIALPAHAAAPTLASAEALVRAQYAADADASPEAAAKLYVPEIAQEMTDPIRGAGAVNLGIDPRYGQDDWKVSDVTVEAAAGPDGRALVTARFLDFGKPARILWTLVPAPDTPSGWRVWDISGPDQNEWAAFDMRQLLNLPVGK